MKNGFPELFIGGTGLHIFGFIMRAIIQRVSEASVTISGRVKSSIGPGLLVLVGIEEEDNETDANWLCIKIANLRIFNDEHQIPNISVKDIGGRILVVSQFTLHATTKKGNRPGYIKAGKPEKSLPLYQFFLKALEAELGKPVGSGQFGADMQVALVNDGPLTIFIDSKNRE